VELDRSRAGRRNLLLALLPAKDLALLAPHLKDIVLEQGAVLQEQGERIEQVYFPRDGIVSLLAVMRQGDAIETATIGYEGAVGTFAALGSRRAHTRAIVQVRGVASRIAASRFRKVAEQSEAVCRIAVRYGEMLLIQVQQTAACNALHPVEARLSRWLLQARDRLESNKINLTHEFLSQMLGVRRTTVTVVANMLQQAGLIRYHRGQIEIVDWEGLQARACECYEAIRRHVQEITPAGGR
jgi:CRP-like cAMP-binding protein